MRNARSRARGETAHVVLLMPPRGWGGGGESLVQVVTGATWFCACESADVLLEKGSCSLRLEIEVGRGVQNERYSRRALRWGFVAVGVWATYSLNLLMQHLTNTWCKSRE
jgi:hypothetical protein